MNKIFITTKEGKWWIVDKLKYKSGEYPSFLTKIAALRFLKEKYNGTDTRAIISGRDGKILNHIIFEKNKRVVAYSLVEKVDATDSLKTEEIRVEEPVVKTKENWLKIFIYALVIIGAVTAAWVTYSLGLY